MDWTTQRLKSFGPRIACIEAGSSWTYQELAQRIDQFKAELPTGQCEVIAIQTESSFDGIAAVLAIAATQHIALPLPQAIPQSEQAQMCQVAASTHRLNSKGIAASDPAGNTPPPLYRRLSNAGLVLFSSGSSGEPKGMLHDLNALLNRYKSIKSRQDRSLLLLLIDHIGGLDSAFRCLFAGSTLVIPEARTPEAAAQAIEQHRVNILPASPSFLNLMLLNQVAQNYNLSSLEIIAYGAEAMPAHVLEKLASTFPQANLQQKFGTSETGAVRICSKARKSLFFRIEDSDTEWKIIEDVLWLKTPSRILGYLNAPTDSLEADGWYATGDLVESDESGNLRIIGRESAWINVGGQKVHPAEVEAAINTMPQIEASRVYAEPDPITGSTVCCEIVVNEPKELRAWKRAIRNHCRGKLAPWKIPSRLAVADSLTVTHRLKQSGG